MKVRVLAVLAAGSLLLSASGSALAGGSWGACGGADEFVLSGSEEDEASPAGADVTPLLTPGGKLGVGGGDG
ncbi:MAG: hypothetical protein K0S78_5315 [Thermomicrobiales bacterium]|jgi:hypothetical protein|nr:hypothetical protein [Thermomicrobiales bacterium]MDF3040375.1 hypothetical protein [Thermomicrobiales bacterium]